jgi:hypothetical protein
MANPLAKNTIKQTYIQNKQVKQLNATDNYVVFQTIKKEDGILLLDVNYCRVTVSILKDTHTGDKFTGDKFASRFFDAEKGPTDTDDILPGKFILIDGRHYFRYDYSKIKNIETIMDPINAHFIELIIHTTNDKIYKFNCIDRKLIKKNLQMLTLPLKTTKPNSQISHRRNKSRH